MQENEKDTLSLLWRSKERIFTKVSGFHYGYTYQSNNVFLVNCEPRSSWSARTNIRLSNYGVVADGASAQEALSSLELKIKEIGKYWEY
jgi:hypothetical protein